MTEYVVACQDLGFVCDWQTVSDRRTAPVAALVDHLNEEHGTGTTSPALSALIDRHIIELPGRRASGHPTHS